MKLSEFYKKVGDKCKRLWPDVESFTYFFDHSTLKDGAFHIRVFGRYSDYGKESESLDIKAKSINEVFDILNRKIDEIPDDVELELE